jgi:hypothetical protein
VINNAAVFIEPFRLDLDKIPFGYSREGLAPSWQLDLSECALLWPSQATMLQGGANSTWHKRGFVVHEAGQLALDAQCGVERPGNPFTVVVPSAGGVVLVLLGGGLGDGLVITPKGPIGPGDPLYPAAQRLASKIAADGKRLANLAKRR